MFPKGPEPRQSKSGTNRGGPDAPQVAEIRAFPRFGGPGVPKGAGAEAFPKGRKARCSLRAGGPGVCKGSGALALPKDRRSLHSAPLETAGLRRLWERRGFGAFGNAAAFSPSGMPGPPPP